jgi:hypothetical protein
VLGRLILKEGPVGIRTIVAIGLGVIAITAQASADTNSWTSGAPDYWDNGGNWSLGTAPTNTDTADFITNITSKVVLIDFYDTGNLPGVLTISNLTVSGFGGATNTLSLTNMNLGGQIPLNILNRLTFGNGGLLQINNSMLRTLNGTFTSGSILQFALGTNFSPVVVSNNLALAGTLNVTDGGGFTNTTYALFTYGGTLTYSGLIVGPTPSNSTCVVSTNTVGQVNLVVTLAPPPSPLPFQIISIVRNTNDITVTWTTSATGTNFVQVGNGDANGVYDTNNFQDIGTVSVSAGTTNSYPDVGGATNKPSRFYRIRYSY